MESIRKLTKFDRFHKAKNYSMRKVDVGTFSYLQVLRETHF